MAGAPASGRIQGWSSRLTLPQCVVSKWQAHRSAGSWGFALAPPRLDYREGTGHSPAGVMDRAIMDQRASSSVEWAAAGAAFAPRVRHGGMPAGDIVLFDRETAAERPTGAPDVRILALNAGSLRFLDALGVGMHYPLPRIRCVPSQFPIPRSTRLSAPSCLASSPATRTSRSRIWFRSVSCRKPCGRRVLKAGIRLRQAQFKAQRLTATMVIDLSTGRVSAALPCRRGWCALADPAPGRNSRPWLGLRADRACRHDPAFGSAWRGGRAAFSTHRPFRNSSA